MSKTIDQRVVEMRFDNAQFEKNVSTSMGTLEKLKSALKLDGATKGLDMVSARASKGVNLESIANSVTYLEKRFSNMGIVGMEVIRKLTDAAINFSTGVMRSVGDSIISGGIRRAQNIENAHFQLQGLLKDEEQVQAIMSDAMDSVDGTAYAYDEAAKAASMFAASGLKAGEQMQTSLRAITGVAAITNANYSDISYIFTQIAGKGRIMGEDLNQFANRGMNAAATLAKYYREVKGEVDMTEQGIRDLISDKNTNIYFDEFAAAMNWAFGDQAKKANETFNGALANIRAALSRIGAKFVSPLLVQNGEFVQLFNTIRERVNDINSMMDPFANKFTSIVKGMASSLNDYLGSFDRQQEIFQTMPKLYRIFSNSVATAQHVLHGFGSIIKPIIQGLSRFMPPDILGRIADFTATLRKATKNFEISDKTADNLRHTFQGISAVIHMVGKTIMFVAEPILKLAGNVLPKLASGILSITGPIGQGLVKIDLFFGNFENGLKKLQSSLGITLPKMSDFISESQKFRLFSAIGTIITRVKEAFSGFGAEVKKVFDQIKGKALEKFGQGLQGVLSTIKSSGAAVIEGFIQAIEKLSQMEFKIPINIADIKTFFTNIGSVFATGIGGIITISQKFGEKISGYLAPSQELIKNAKDRFAKFTGGISEAVDKKNPLRELLATVNTGLLGALILRLTQFIKKLKDSSGSLKKSITGTLTEVKKTLQAYQKDLKANSLLKIGAAIGILAGSLWVLAQIPVKQLLPAAGALAGIGSALALFMKLISGEGNSAIAITKQGVAYKSTTSFVKDVAPALLAFAGAVFIISKALESLKFAGFKDYALRMGALVVVFAVIEGAAVSMLKLSEKLEGNTKEYLTVAAGVVIFSLAISKIADAVARIGSLDTKSALQGIFGVVAIMVGLTKLLESLDKIDTKKMLGAGAAMTFMAAALTILIIPVTALGLLPWSVVSNGLIAVGIALIEFSVTLNILSEIDWKTMVGGGVAMIAMAAALTMLVVPITAFGLIPFPVIAKGMGAVAVALIGMSVALKVLSNSSGANMVGAGAGMIAIAAAMNLLVPPIAALGALPLGVIAKGVGAVVVALMGIAVAGAIAAAGATGLLALGAALLMMGGAVMLTGVGIGLIGAGLMSLAGGLLLILKIGEPAANAIVNAITIIATGIASLAPKMAEAFGLAMVTFIETVLAQIPEIAPLLSEAITNLIVYALAGLVAAIPAVKEATLILLDSMLAMLVEYTPRIIDNFMTWIIQIIDGITARIPELVTSIANFLNAVVSSIVEEIKKLNGSEVLDAMIAFGAVSAIVAALGALLPLIPPAMLAVVGFGVVITELAIVLAAIGALSQIPGLKDFVDSGGDLLQSVGTAIGKFVGGLVGGFAEGVSAQLVQIGKDLSDFMTNVQPFIDKASKIDASLLEGTGYLAGAIIAITAAELINGIANFLSGGKLSLKDFGDQIAELGPGMAAFGEAVKDIDPSAVEASASAAKMIAELINTLPREGGVLEKIFGQAQSLSQFAKDLIPFGRSMKLYSKVVQGVTPEAVEGSVRAAQMLSDMAKTLPNSGGLAAVIFGDNKLSDFANELIPFGKAMVEYANSVINLDPDTVLASVTAAKAIAELANGLPNEGGIISWFTGENSMDVFGSQLKSFGEGVAGYSESISGKVDLPTMQSTLIELNKLLDFCQRLDGLDTNVLQEFSYNLEQLGASGVDSFVGAFEGSTGRVIQAVTSMIGMVTGGISTNMPTLTASGTTAGETVVNGINNGIVNTTSKLMTTITTLCSNVVKKFQEGLHQKIFRDIGANYIIYGIIHGMNMKKQELFSTIRTICNSVIETFKSGLPTETFVNIGRSVIEGIISGLKDEGKINEMKEAALSLVNKIKETLEGADADFENIGKNIDEGIAKGIRDNGEAVAKALKEIIDKAIAKEKKRLGIESPSKVMAEDGMYMMLGMAKGIRDYSDLVPDATEETADKAIDSMRNAIRRIADLVDSEMDIQPTIAPVVDLTNVQNGAKKMRGILTRGISTSFSYNKALNASTTNVPDALRNSTDRTSTVSNSYNFTQNNYSPKALSRKEIYRQTRNQFSALKGAVSGI